MSSERPLDHGQGSDDANDDEQSPSIFPAYLLSSTMTGTLIHHQLSRKTPEVINRQRVDPGKPSIDDQDGIDESAHHRESRKTTTQANSRINTVSLIGR
jgi:hypothetical protein